MQITEHALLQIIEDTWNSTLGFQIDCQPAPPLTAEVLTVRAGISGAWSGEVQLDCPLPLARHVAAAIFQVREENVGREDILDALSELVHIVGGNLKALLPQPAQISLPVASDGTGHSGASQAPLISRLALTSSGHPFVVTLRGGPSAAGWPEAQGARSPQQPPGER